ncbi:hypothetical protein BDW59DRAFT_147850, partial [Aspergillus cavernicola]
MSISWQFKPTHLVLIIARQLYSAPGNREHELYDECSLSGDVARGLITTSCPVCAGNTVPGPLTTHEKGYSEDEPVFQPAIMVMLTCSGLTGIALVIACRRCFVFGQGPVKFCNGPMQAI